MKSIDNLHNILLFSFVDQQQRNLRAIEWFGSSIGYKLKAQTL